MYILKKKNPKKWVHVYTRVFFENGWIKFLILKICHFLQFFSKKMIFLLKNYNFLKFDERKIEFDDSKDTKKQEK